MTHWSQGEMIAIVQAKVQMHVSPPNGIKLKSRLGEMELQSI